MNLFFPLFFIIYLPPNLKKELMKNHTDEIGNIKAVGETAGGTMSRIVESIRRRIGSCSCDKVIVVAIVDEGVPEHEESSSLSSARH